MYSSLVYKNDHVTLCHKACKACWGKPLAQHYFDMCKFIENRVKVGHESVLEHSNVVMEFVQGEDAPNFGKPSLADQLFEIVGDTKFLNIATEYVNGQEYLLIGGSIRAYKELIRYTEYPNSELLTVILKTLTQNLDPCYFTDFIEAGLCTEDDFAAKPMYNYVKENACHSRKELPFSTIENVDSFDELWNNLLNPEVYSTRDLYKMLTITVNFRDLSRAASHQLVRHRNGITQSSMRYIDCSNAKFHIPPTVEGVEYELDILGGKHKMTFDDVLRLELSIYEQFRQMGMQKEDARGILGINTKTNDLYMTFTYIHFIKFLELRTDSHAQFEIRERALELYKYIVEEASLLPDNLYDYLIPYFIMYKDEMFALDDLIDEVVEEYDEDIFDDEGDNLGYEFKSDIPRDIIVFLDEE